MSTCGLVQIGSFTTEIIPSIYIMYYAVCSLISNYLALRSLSPGHNVYLTLDCNRPLELCVVH